MIKKTVKQIAKAIAQEPIEILKTAGRQIGGVVETPKEQPKQPQGGEQSRTIDEQKLQNQSARQIQALETEIQNIRVQKQQKEQEVKQQEVAPPPVVEAPPNISSKPQRGRLKGMKQKIKDMTNRTEIRKQSSG